MSKETEYLYVTRIEGNPEKYPFQELLHGRSMVSAQSIESSFGDVVKVEREYHRRSVAEKVVEAMYKGWLPYKMEWWEGYVGNDAWLLRNYVDGRQDDMYHFFTRIRFAGRDTPMAKRNGKSPYESSPTAMPEVTISSLHPEPLEK